MLPGRLLVGAYPASMNDSHHAHLLCTILLQGVSTFVCLQQEYRAEGVTEEMWRSGDALRPYFQDVVQLLAKLGELRRADPRSVPAICAPEEADFVHFPIVDCNVADDTKVCFVDAEYIHYSFCSLLLVDALRILRSTAVAACLFIFLLMHFAFFPYFYVGRRSPALQVRTHVQPLRAS